MTSDNKSTNPLLYFEIESMSTFHEQSTVNLHPNVKAFIEKILEIHTQEKIPANSTLFQHIYTLDVLDHFPQDGYTMELESRSCILIPKDTKPDTTPSSNPNPNHLQWDNEESATEMTNKKRYALGIDKTSRLPICIFLLESNEESVDNVQESSLLYKIGCVKMIEVEEDKVMKLPVEPVDTNIPGTIVPYEISILDLKKLIEGKEMNQMDLVLFHTSE